MSSRTPSPCCAWCGVPLAYVPDRVTVRFKLPGRPTIGWHLGACEQHDRPIAGPCGTELLLRIAARPGDRILSLHRDENTKEYRWRPGLTSKAKDAIAKGGPDAK